jgi:hypothetical protein
MGISMKRSTCINPKVSSANKGWFANFRKLCMDLNKLRDNGMKGLINPC